MLALGPIISYLGVWLARICDKPWLKTATASPHDKSSMGRCLRRMLVFCCVMMAILHTLLTMVPVTDRIELPGERRPTVQFTCDRQGAIIRQGRCRMATSCHEWSSVKEGALALTNCNYTCGPILERSTTAVAPIKVISDNIAEAMLEDGSGEVAQPAIALEAEELILVKVHILVNKSTFVKNL